MEKHYNKYEFIRYSTDPSGTLTEDLSRLLRAQGVRVEEDSINYIADSLRSGRTAHTTVSSVARTYLEQRIRNSPYLMELIVRLFYNDFVLFKYDLPNLDEIETQIPTTVSA
ncbi:unnamed protein product [Cylicostephanus goldi]|uniref:Uncharacterized protein n=1 Tax=Cylicostephanus goldi TaxID=71465 RepID=A0A3P6UPN7_CYLGO|nr:unnamed protein product [Cylicostephanus goldi]